MKSHSRAVFALLLCVLCFPSLASHAADPADPKAARISGVYFDGTMKGDPEPEESIRLVNTDPQRVLDLGDFALTDKYGPPRPKRKGHAKHTAEERREDVVDDGPGGADPGTGELAMEPTHTVRIPQGTRLPPGGELWIANDGSAFKLVFGFPPGLEAVDTLDTVPQAFLLPGWLNLPAHQGVLALTAPDGRVVDVVAWDSANPKDKPLELGRLPAGSWSGPAVALQDSSPFGWKGQVLARDRDEAGHVLEDTDSAADWDSGFSRKQLGVEANHRVEFPGQTRFVSARLKNVQAKVTCGSAPENQFNVLADAIDSAKTRIRINVYQFTNPALGDRLMAALKRGVKLTMLMEGVPVGGLPDEERVILDGLATAGARIVFLGKKTPKDPVNPRYRFDHAKYTLIDDRMAIIGTENYGKTGHPVDPSHGNRGFEVAIENPAFVQQLGDVFDGDTDVSHQDLVGSP